MAKFNKELLQWTSREEMKLLNRNSNHNPPLNNREYYLSKQTKYFRNEINNQQPFHVASSLFYKMWVPCKTLNHFGELVLFTLWGLLLDYVVPLRRFIVHSQRCRFSQPTMVIWLKPLLHLQLFIYVALIWPCLHGQWSYSTLEEFYISSLFIYASK